MITQELFHSWHFGNGAGACAYFKAIFVSSQIYFFLTKQVHTRAKNIVLTILSNFVPFSLFKECFPSFSNDAMLQLCSKVK